MINHIILFRVLNHFVTNLKKWSVGEIKPLVTDCIELHGLKIDPIPNISKMEVGVGIKFFAANELTVAICGFGDDGCIDLNKGFLKIRTSHIHFGEFACYADVSDSDVPFMLQLNFSPRLCLIDKQCKRRAILRLTPTCNDKSHRRHSINNNNNNNIFILVNVLCHTFVNKANKHKEAKESCGIHHRRVFRFAVAAGLFFNIYRGNFQFLI